MSSKRFEHLAAATCLTLATLLVFSKLTRNPTDLLVGAQRGGRNDLTSQMLAFRGAPQAAMARYGDLPLWQDFGLLGAPWLGYPQSALFYPPHWLFFVLAPLSAISWLIVAHHAFAGAGVYLLCRRYGCGWIGAATGGVCFLGAPFLIAQTGEGHVTQIFLISWTPWAVVAWERLRSGARGGWALLSVILALAFFCGHVQEVYYLVLILTALTMFDIGVRPEGVLGSVALARSWILTGLATAGLVAVELIPNWRYTRHGVRALGMDAEAASQISAGWQSLRQLANPFALGGPADYAGPGDLYWETVFCFGVAAFLLAVCGAALSRQRGAALRWTVVALLTALFALGTDFPLFEFMHRYVLGISLFRSPSRALFFTSFAVSVLAGLGVEAIHSWRSLLPSMPKVRTVTALAALLICTLESGWWSSQMLATIPQASIRSDSPVAMELSARMSPGSRVIAEQELLSDRECWNQGIDKLRRYEPVPLTRTMVLVASLAPNKNPAEELTGFAPLKLDDYEKPLLDMLGVSHAVLIDRNGVKHTGWQVVARKLMEEEVAIRGRTARRIPYLVLENPNAMPRAYVVGRAKLTSSPQQLEADLRKLNVREEVLLDRDPLPAGPRQSYRAAKVIERGANRIVLDAELDQPGYLVVTESYFPGWKIDVDGQPGEMLPANVAARAVPLGPGSHRVTMEFTPPGLMLGGAVSLLAWLLTLAALIQTAAHRPGMRRRNNEGFEPIAPNCEPDGKQKAEVSAQEDVVLEKMS